MLNARDRPAVCFFLFLGRVTSCYGLDIRSNAFERNPTLSAVPLQICLLRTKFVKWTQVVTNHQHMERVGVDRQFCLHKFFASAQLAKMHTFLMSLSSFLVHCPLSHLRREIMAIWTVVQSNEIKIVIVNWLITWPVSVAILVPPVSWATWHVNCTLSIVCFYLVAEQHSIAGYVNLLTMHRQVKTNDIMFQCFGDLMIWLRFH